MNIFLTVSQEHDRQYMHIGTMVEFAFALVGKLDVINKHSFNDFKLRVGELHKNLCLKAKCYESEVFVFLTHSSPTCCLIGLCTTDRKWKTQHAPSIIEFSSWGICCHLPDIKMQQITEMEYESTTISLILAVSYKSFAELYWQKFYLIIFNDTAAVLILWIQYECLLKITSLNAF